MQNDETDERQPLYELMQALSMSQQSLERYLATALAVDHAGLMVVNHLIATSAAATPSDLASIAGVSPAVMSLVLHRLEDAGHVRRAPHPGDRRKVCVSTTPATTEAALGLIQPVIAELVELESDMTEHDRAVVARFLTHVAELYQRVATR